jgi:hypothetical protein
MELQVAQSIKKLFGFYGTRYFIAMFKIVLH